MKRSVMFSIALLSICLFQAGASAGETLAWRDCIAEAKKNHPDLISAEEQVNQQEAGRAITGSGLYPQVDVSVDGSTAKTTVRKDTYSYGVTGTQLIYNGSKTINDLKAASENIKAAQYNYRFTSSGVRFRLRTAFIDLLKAQELLNITEDIAKIRRDNLVLITLRYEAGIEHKGAVLTAEANLDEAQFEITQAKRELEVSQRSLLKEMGRTGFSAMRVEGEFKVGDSGQEEPDFEALARGNPSLEKLIAQASAASFSIKSAEADFFPQVTASAGADRTGSRFPPDQDQWNIGVGLSMPVFEGGLRTAEVKKAKAVFNQAVADERSGKDGVILALGQTWKALKDAVDTVGVQKKFLDAAEERARIAEGQYSLGLIQFDNWTIIEDNLVQAKKTFLNAEANAMLAEASWVQAKGETLEHAD